VTFYPVKLLFIAGSVVNYAFVEPSASFDSRVASNKMVFLPP